MKITHVTTRALRAPADNPFVVGIPTGDATREYVTVEVHTDQGIHGIGITLFAGKLIDALKQAVDALSALIIGENPLHVEAIAAKLWRAASFSGPGGIFTLALSAIDIALWDIKGKAFSLPLCSLVGGYRDRVPTYASGALMRSAPLDYLAQAGPRLVGLGFKQMKMQLGQAPSIAQEVERVRIVRESIGTDIDLMVDVNQHWGVKEAIKIGHRLEPYNLFWLEDPVAHDDYPGMARVTEALTTPVVAGEYQYGIRPFRHMLEAGAVDIVMIDLVRAGGITQWLKIAGMAEAFNLPVVSHLLPEIHVHLIAGIPNGLTVEYMPWTLPFFEETPAIEGGELVVPQKPGLGLAFDRDAITHYAIGSSTIS